MSDMSNSINTCFAKYATFKGRANRKEYWWFFLFTFLLNVLLDIWAGVQGINDVEGKGSYQIIKYIMEFILTFPSLAVTTRRLHDIGKSGWWQLLWITVIGAIPLVIWLGRISDENQNKYD